MPTIASSVVPSPKSWDEFEDIALASAKLRWNSDDFFRNGRQGQKQDGVDIWGHDDDDNHIGVQCKNTIDGVSLATVKTEIANAESFEPALDKLYIATTAKRDATLQKEVRKLSADRRKASKFKVDLLFWDDVIQEVAKDDDVFFSFYPQFRQKVDGARQHDLVLFNGLKELLKSDGVIGFLDRTNMAGFSFSNASLEPLREFNYDWGVPEKEFLTPALEEIRSKLWSKADAYLGVIALETFATNSPGRLTVPPEWEYEHPGKFHRAVKSLHGLAQDIVTLHGELIRTGKKFLIE